MDEAEQNIVICQWRADLREADNSRYSTITKFNNFIIRSLSLFFNEHLREAVSSRCLQGVKIEIKWFASHFNFFLTCKYCCPFHNKMYPSMKNFKNSLQEIEIQKKVKDIHLIISSINTLVENLV